jgi:hypothetical protein
MKKLPDAQCKSKKTEIAIFSFDANQLPPVRRITR